MKTAGKQRMARVKIVLDGYRCERCGHEWVPRTKTEEVPTICPKCKSPYWNKPRKNAVKKKARGGDNA